MNNSRFQEIWKLQKPIIGMVHLQALPGTPGYCGNLKGIIEYAIKDAEALAEGGVNAIQIENQFDTPYCLPDNIGAETVAIISVVADKLVQMFPEIPVGINVHMNGAIQALAIAKASGAQFIRCFNLMNAYISNSGYVGATAPALMRYRRSIDAEDIMVFGDFQVKHGSHAITADRTLEEKAQDIQTAKAEAAILTGISTGVAPDAQSIKRVKSSIAIPLIIGSGLSVKNCQELWPLVDGAIIGSG
ncbi:MAG: BtpA/SgcQ family protein, partial [Christensenellaceae bacterium]